MDKYEAAAEFFERLSNESREFITLMIKSQMDDELVELLSTLGGKLKLPDEDQGRQQASLLILGYLLRAFEEMKLEEHQYQDSDKVLH